MYFFKFIFRYFTMNILRWTFTDTSNKILINTIYKIPLQTQRFIPVESDTISPNICGFGIGLILETSVSPETCLFFEALSFASVSEDIFFKDCRWIGATRSTIGSFFLYSRFKSIFSMFYRMVVLLERKLIFTENVCTFCMWLSTL